LNYGLLAVARWSRSKAR